MWGKRWISWKQTFPLELNLKNVANKGQIRRFIAVMTSAENVSDTFLSCQDKFIHFFIKIWRVLCWGFDQISAKRGVILHLLDALQYPDHTTTLWKWSHPNVNYWVKHKNIFENLKRSGSFICILFLIRFHSVNEIAGRRVSEGWFRELSTGWKSSATMHLHTFLQAGLRN